jgi:hypothetical protein
MEHFGVVVLSKAIAPSYVHHVITVLCKTVWPYDPVKVGWGRNCLDIMTARGMYTTQHAYE